MTQCVIRVCSMSFGSGKPEQRRPSGLAEGGLGPLACRFRAAITASNTSPAIRTRSTFFVPRRRSRLPKDRQDQYMDRTDSLMGANAVMNVLMKGIDRQEQG